MPLLFCRSMLTVLAALCLSPALHAQWTMLDSPTTANLLSVDTRAEAVWASGQDGVVIHSADEGRTWATCVPVGQARGLALTSIAAIDSATAVAISTGKGVASKAYRTSDGCKSWQIVFDNPEEAGSFDSLRRVAGQQLYLLGEPVSGKFAMYYSRDGGAHWFVTDDAGLDASPGETAAGAALAVNGPFLYFGTRGSTEAKVHFTHPVCKDGKTDSCPVEWTSSRVLPTAGQVKSVGTRNTVNMSGQMSVFVLGIVLSADGAAASVSSDGSQWSSPVHIALAHPNAVIFVPGRQLWLAVGEDGTAVGSPRGERWTKIAPAGGAVGASWSAMALPFAVGTSGHVGRLNVETLR